jgi:hypothetical protein
VLLPIICNNSDRFIPPLLFLIAPLRADHTGADATVILHCQ